MTVISRSLARQLRAVFKKAVPRGGGPLVVVSLGTTAQGPIARLHRADMQIENGPAGFAPTGELTLPFSALADFEGRKGDVTLEPADEGRVTARWEDEGVPRVTEYEAKNLPDLPPFPDRPKRMTEVEPALLRALADAIGSAARENPRYAVTCVQFRGSREIVATDGRQLLVQGGFSFPWKEDVLVPATPVFACDELAREEAVSIGKTDTHVVLRAGPWTLFLLIDLKGRFPDTGAIISGPSKVKSRCKFDANDAHFVEKTLSRLPGAHDDHAPVTLDLNGKVLVRAKGQGQEQTTELDLVRSEATGKAVRLNIDRTLFGRAMKLGFTEVGIVDADTPVQFREGDRTFVIMPLDKKGALEESENAVQVSSSVVGKAPVAAVPRSRKKKKATAVLPTSNGSNGHVTTARNSSATPPETNGNGCSDLLAEVQALREVLREAHGRAGRLVTAIRHQRKHSRIMKSTLASLKELQHIDG